MKKVFLSAAALVFCASISYAQHTADEPIAKPEPPAVVVPELSDPAKPDNNHSSIKQTSDGNGATVTQSGEKNSSIIEQSGDILENGPGFGYSDATVSQTGDINSAQQVQIGGSDATKRNSATITQIDNDNRAHQYQKGSGNTANATQDTNPDDYDPSSGNVGLVNESDQVQIGDGNNAVVDQKGIFHDAIQYQDGDANYASSTQTDVDSDSEQVQMGNGNSATSVQAGLNDADFGFNKVNQFQMGNDNVATANQDGRSLTATQEQNGQYNNADVIQTGEKNTSAQVQDGSGSSTAVDYNNAHVNQSGAGNTAYQKQAMNGTGFNSAIIVQVDGNLDQGHIASQTQDGNNLRATAIQSGWNQRSNQIQSGAYNDAVASQSGDFNYSRQTQEGTGAAASFNTSIVTQKAVYVGNVSFTDQLGGGANAITVGQFSDANFSKVMQDGAANTANVLQQARN